MKKKKLTKMTTYNVDIGDIVYYTVTGKTGQVVCFSDGKVGIDFDWKLCNHEIEKRRVLLIRQDKLEKIVTKDVSQLSLVI